MPKLEMLINYVAGEECRIAVTHDGRLAELYHERASSSSHVGNIYKGRVTNVEPSIQAAFVDFGLERNGFLHISDLHPKYFPKAHREEVEAVGKKTPRRDRPPIQDCLKRGNEILVQVLKEGIGTKGPTLTSYLSIPGRFLVMMPSMERLGVSRRIDDDDHRRSMRKMLDELNPPDGYGFIIRTAGMDRTKTDLKRDLAYLTRLWKTIERRQAKVKVGELYTESDLIVRTLRDIFSNEIDRIIVDDISAAERARDFLAISSPRSQSKVLYYDEAVPLFHRFGVEQQIDNIHARHVPLPSGGSLVIDQTEALVAIDVNSGKMRTNNDAETTAYKTNIEACDEICRQLKLRDLGGVVVMDLIDMRMTKHRKALENRFRDNLKNDRARTKALSISQFGILEMTRQRMRPSLTSSAYEECDSCRGEGWVKKADSVVLDIMRRLALSMQNEKVTAIELMVSPSVAFPLLNRKRGMLAQLEQTFDKQVLVRVRNSATNDQIDIRAIDERGGEVDFEDLKSMKQPSLQSVDEALGALAETMDDDFDSDDAEETDETTPKSSDSAEGEQKQGKKRRRRRGGRGKGQQSSNSEKSEAQTDAPAEEKKEDKDQAKKDQDQTESDTENKTDAEANASEEAKPKKRRRRRRRSKGAKPEEGDSSSSSESNASDQNQGKDAEAEKTDSDNKTDQADQNGQTSTEDSGNQSSSSGKRRRTRRGGKKHRARREAAERKNAEGDHSSEQKTTSISSGYSNRIIPAVKDKED